MFFLVIRGLYEMYTFLIYFAGMTKSCVGLAYLCARNRSTLSDQLFERKKREQEGLTVKECRFYLPLGLLCELNAFPA